MENKKTGHLAITLRRFREKNGFTQEFVASKLNVSRSTYSYYEIGKTEPNIKSLSIIAKMFGVKVEDFLENEKTISFYDSNSSIRPQLPPTTMGNLSQEERELIAMYRLVTPKEKRRVVLELEKNK